MSEVPPTVLPPSSDVTDNDKLMAGLSYFLTPIVPAIVLLSPDMKARPFQYYHAVQALGLLGAELILTTLLCVVFTICTVLTLGIGSILYCLLILAYIPQIYYAIIAYTRGQYFEIPTLTQFMVQQGWLKRP